MKRQRENKGKRLKDRMQRGRQKNRQRTNGEDEEKESQNKGSRQRERMTGGRWKDRKRIKTVTRKEWSERWLTVIRVWPFDP